MSKHHHHHHHHDYCRHAEEDICDKLYKHCCIEKSCGPHFTKAEALVIAKRLCLDINSCCFDLDKFWLKINGQRK